MPLFAALGAAEGEAAHDGLPRHRTCSAASRRPATGSAEHVIFGWAASPTLRHRPIKSPTAVALLFCQILPPEALPLRSCDAPPARLAPRRVGDPPTPLPNPRDPVHLAPERSPAMDPATLTASALTALIRSRQLSAVESLKATLARIDRLNPNLNAIVQRMDDQALAAAAAIDARIAKGEDPGPLAGVPVTVKVNMTSRARPPPTACASGQPHRGRGQPARRQPRPRRGHHRRPHQHPRLLPALVHPQQPARRNEKSCLPRLTPGGSSGGAASAVAAGLGAIAHGTDIAGSIRYPAYACGIHGLRPGLGRVPAFNATAGDRLIGGQLWPPPARSPARPPTSASASRPSRSPTRAIPGTPPPRLRPTPNAPPLP